jgi:small subunit ribosomal protein S21
VDLAVEEQNQDGEGDDYLEVKVYGNDLEQALKVLKRQIQKDGLFKEIKKRSFYEKPSVKEKRKRIEARKKKMKAMRFKRRG